MSGVELLSVHVPKTAGTSFRVALETVYGADCVHSVYPSATYSRRFESQEERWLTDSLELCRRTVNIPRVVHGHYLLTMYSDRFPGAAKVAWLRHPVDRLISFFYWWREMELWPTASDLQRAVQEGRVSLLEFARHRLMRDQVTSRFLGDPAGRGLTFIGIQERFDEDLRDLGKLLGWPQLAARRTNVNQSDVYFARSVDAGVRAEIANLNPADMRLYAAVLDGTWRPEGWAT